MEPKQLWAKLSGSINFFIKGIWREDLLKSNEVLLQEFIHYSLIEGESKDYQYLDNPLSIFHLIMKQLKG